MRPLLNKLSTILPSDANQLVKALLQDYNELIDVVNKDSATIEELTKEIESLRQQLADTTSIIIELLPQEEDEDPILPEDYNDKEFDPL